MLQPRLEKDAAVFLAAKDLAKNLQMSYTYDEISRVTNRTLLDLATEQSTEEQFTYDAAGNITGSGDTLCNYDSNNRLTAFAGNSLTYDAEGNLLKINGSLSDIPTDFAYDSSNRLISAGDLAYTYNAEDTRIRKVNGDTETLYTYDTTARLSRLLVKSENGVITKYVYGLGLIGEETADTFITYHFDYRGSTVAVTDSTGFVLDTYQYDTYGKLIDGGNSFKTPFLYNGRDGVMTESNGLCYMRARYYSPILRRFINADIVAGSLSDAVTLNRYAYANGNPVSNIDPFGLEVERGSFLNSIINFFKNDTHKIFGDFVYGLLFGFGSVSGGNSNFGVNMDAKKDTYPKDAASVVEGFLGFIAGLSTVNANGTIGFGTENVSISINGNLDILKIWAEAGVRYQKGVGGKAGGEASVASGEVKILINLFGVGIEVGVSADALTAEANVNAGFVKQKGRTKFSVDKDFGFGLFGFGTEFSIVLPF